MINNSTNIKETNKRFSFYKITLDTKRPRHMALEVQGPAWLVKARKRYKNVHPSHYFFFVGTEIKWKLIFKMRI
jgi:hypothetical protein